MTDPGYLPPQSEQAEFAAQPLPRRIPHLGHALLFVALTVVLLLLVEVVLVFARGPHDAQHIETALTNPKLQIIAEALAYLLTLAVSWVIFPLLWSRSFAEGIQWNGRTAVRLAVFLIPMGLALGFGVDAISNHLPVPKEMPIDKFFHTSSDVWLVSIFGTLLGPLFEEVAFRGFLLPAFAIAYDWLSLKRTAEAHTYWQNTATLSRNGLIFSAILTSIFFAMLHAVQLAHAWALVAVLFCVSLILTWVRLRTRSVAASALLHASYNLCVFLVIFIVTSGFRHLDRLAP